MVAAPQTSLLLLLLLFVLFLVNIIIFVIAVDLHVGVVGVGDIMLSQQFSFGGCAVQFESLALPHICPTSLSFVAVPMRTRERVPNSPLKVPQGGLEHAVDVRECRCCCRSHRIYDVDRSVEELGGWDDRFRAVY